MPTNLISPLLWQSVPFKDPDAWLDFLQSHERWHQVLAEKRKTRWQLLDDLREELLPHSRLHDELADSLGLTRATDLLSFDLKDETAFVGFMWVHALDHQRLRTAAGV